MFYRRKDDLFNHNLFPVFYVKALLPKLRIES